MADLSIELEASEDRGGDPVVGKHLVASEGQVAKKESARKKDREFSI